MLEDARQEIEQQKEAALSEVTEVIVDMAIGAASKCSRGEVSAQDHIRLIEDSLNKMDKA
ncbi:MAG: hypothetical protein U5N58_02895 [Actinomycetota bacterium]|nr:hypothetical protein [Actinomycetota bacterium]